MKRVYIACHVTDAHLLRGLLEAEGIDAIVRGQHLFTVRGRVPIASDTLPSVWIVDDEDFDRARQLCADYASRQPTPGPIGIWICPKCEEAIEDQFTQCWNCGGSRPT